MKHFFIVLLVFVPLSFGICLDLDTAVLSLLLIASVITLVIFNLDKLEKISGWGLKVELNKKIKEVEVTLDFIKKILTPFVIEQYRLNNQVERYQRMYTDDSDYPIKKIAKLLGIYDSEELQLLRKDMYSQGLYKAFKALDIHRYNLNTDEHRLSRPVNEQIEKFKESYSPLSNKYPTPVEVTEFYNTIKHHEYVIHSSFLNYEFEYSKYMSFLAELSV